MGDRKFKIGLLSHFEGKNKRKKFFKKTAGVKCRDKLENKLSQKEKVAKDKRFQSQRLIPDELHFLPAAFLP